MLFDHWSDIEKRSIGRISSTCSEILRDVREAVSQTVDVWHVPGQSTPRSDDAEKRRERPEKKRMQKAEKQLPKLGGLWQALGTLFAVSGGIASVFELFYELSKPADGRPLMAIPFAVLALGGVILAAFGSARRKKRKRYRAYLKLIGEQEAVSIHSIADVLGMNYHDVIDDLKDMIQRGILSPAWLDLKTYRLMMTEYTGEIPMEKKEECLSRSERILLQIRADNDLIADKEVSAKIDRIEDLTRKIFAVLDRYPEKEKQLYSFLNYYLPTTLKALESYARLEAQGVETETIRQTKQKINTMLDELCDGYERQLDKLFENEAVDITADIEVMRRMMARDGLKEDDFPTP